jgi:CheY-like chemotaxis protein
MTKANEITVLIADDDDGHAMLIQEQLEDVGLHNKILRFRDGAEVLDFFSGTGGERHREPGAPYLLLLDIRMPKVDGVEVLRHMKGHDELRTIPVIMLTTTDDPHEVAECYALGCNSYVTKPVSFVAFSEVVKRLGLFISVIAVTPSGSLIHQS